MNTKQLAQAFKEGRCARAGSVITNGISYQLHGNVIATRDGDNSLSLHWCGWYTGTTARHMNAILAAFGCSQRVSYAQARDAQTISFGTTF